MGQDTETVTVEATHPTAVARAIEIEVVSGPDRGQRWTPCGHATLGTATDIEVPLTDPTISRRHVGLTPVRGGFWARDLDSKNGTWVEGLRVREVLLPEGSELKLGATTLRLRWAAEVRPSRRFGQFLTADPALQQTLATLERASLSEATILLEGETGTGKELLARAIHQRSPRSAGPLVVLDCGAITASLLESQLFGHTKGAFTGAVQEQAGAFEAAAGGTVFLDELGELPLDLQPKLLRALEARTVRRLGESRDRDIDVRIVAATHRPLQQMVKDGRFRGDLYYRVAVVRVEVPPLRQRPADLPLLATHLVEHLSQGRGSLGPEAFAALSAHDWPGNIRELRNVIERALALAATPHIGPAELFGVPTIAAPTFHQAKDQLILAFEREYVRRLLAQHDGNISRAAQEAGLTRNALYALLKRVEAER